MSDTLFIILAGILIGFIMLFVYLGVQKDSKDKTYIETQCVKTNMVVNTRGGIQTIYDCTKDERWNEHLN